MDFDVEKKYKLTDETIKIDGHILHRIQASKAFRGIKKGELGGFIEKEGNLSQIGTCWIYDNACVYENARVADSACVYANAKISGNASIYDRARVGGYAEIYGNATVYEQATISDRAKVYQNARIHKCTKVDTDASIFGQASIRDNAYIGGNAKIYENAFVCDNAYITGHASIYGYSKIADNSVVGGHAGIYEDAEITGNAEIFSNAIILNKADYIVFKNFWSSGRYFTWTRSNNLWRVGCFLGTGKELIEKAYSDSETSGKEYERIVKYVESVLADEEKTTQYLIQMKTFLSTVIRSIKRFGKKSTEKLEDEEFDKKFIRFFMVFTILTLLWYTILTIFIWN